MNRSLARAALSKLERLRLDSTSLELYEGTLISNRAARKRLGNGTLPPARIIRQIIGSTDAYAYAWSGRVTVTRILDLLNSGGVEWSQIRTILDFGCGAGRLSRHFLLHPGKEVYGSDTDHGFIGWCRAGLPDGTFVLNGPSSLPFEDGKFDLVVSYSVFTHLPPESQLSWFREIGRALRPGGFLVFSTRAIRDIRQQWGVNHISRVEAFERGEIVTVGGEEPWFACDTYHPPGAIERLAKESGMFEHVRTALALPAPPMDSAGHNLHLWRKVN